MTIEILMPSLSPTMKEGNLAKWLKKEGDKISNGDILAEIETDKATMEVEAIDDGVLGKIIVAENTQNVPVNNIIAVLLEDGENKDVLKDYEPEKIKKKEEKKVAPKETISPAVKVPQANVAQTATSFSNSNIIASPVTKKIAELNKLNLANIKGTGPKGRIIKEDVMNFLSNPVSSDLIVRNREEYQAIPNDNIRRIIASRLLESKQTVPHFYLTIDCNIDSLLELRAGINNEAAKDESGKPSYKVSVNDLIVKAVALALKKVPKANSSWQEEAILQYNNIDISIAVATDDGGLITPIVRNADQKRVIAISSEIKSLVKKAKAGTLFLEEFQGGGFSVSNLGMYGIKEFKAIINPPQACILAIGAGEKRAIVKKNGNVQSATMMSVSLSCDHRAVDGAIGALFLNAFQKAIENPASLLL